MSAGIFNSMPPKVCRGCGALGEFPGFLCVCPACQAAA